MQLTEALKDIPVKQPTKVPTPAVIIAGGQGARMGGVDKCLQNVGSSTILSRIIESLSQQTSSVFLNINGDQKRFQHFGLPLITDHCAAPIGPLGGINSALHTLGAQNTPYTTMLTVAGDCPFLPETLITTLIEAKQTGDEVIFCHSNGRDHFMIALWATSILPKLTSFIDNGGRSVGKFIASLQHRCVHFNHTPIDPFFNINTPAQLELANRYIHIENEKKSKTHRS